MPDHWPRSSLSNIANAIYLKKQAEVGDQGNQSEIESIADDMGDVPIRHGMSPKLLDPKDLTPDAVVNKLVDQGYKLIIRD